MSNAEADKMSRPRGRRELTTMQAVKQLSTGQSRLPDWTREVLAKVNSYQSGRLCCSENVVAQFVGLGSLSLRGAKFLAYARNRLRNLGGEANEIATPRQVGARNDKRAWWWMKEAAIKIWGRDRQEPVSSLVLAPVAQTSSNFSYHLVCPAGAGRGWLRMMNRTTISAHEAFSTGRVPVGRGRQKHLKSSWGGVKINK